MTRTDLALYIAIAAAVVAALLLLVAIYQALLCGASAATSG